MAGSALRGAGPGTPAPGAAPSPASPTPSPPSRRRGPDLRAPGPGAGRRGGHLAAGAGLRAAAAGAQRPAGSHRERDSGQPLAPALPPGAAAVSPPARPRPGGAGHSPARPDPALRSAPRTRIPETAPVGTALGTFTCEDPDSPGSTLHYQLRAHSPRGLASLRLRDRVLEVLPAPGPPQGAWEGWGQGLGEPAG